MWATKIATASAIDIRNRGTNGLENRVRQTSIDREAAMSAKMLGASIVAAIGITVVYPSENYAMGLCIGMAVCALLANFRD